MKTLRYRSKGEEVHLLEEVLEKLGYKVYVSNYFAKDTDIAVKDFQLKNNLVVDGIVGVKTWLKLLAKQEQLGGLNDKFLSEKDLNDFAQQNGLELAAVKAVNEVESRGKGFLAFGKPVILFEGHVFWRQLEKRGINPNEFLTEHTKDILYEKWTRKFYKGGTGEYHRLEKAAGLSDLPEVRDAAYCSASWGSFQIMGYHFKKLGYDSVDEFVSAMNKHEREHLNAFGKFVATRSFSGKKLRDWLKEKNWEKFANGYNGSGYKKNKYDSKLETAYKKYNVQMV
jgi:hypothetical protein